MKTLQRYLLRQVVASLAMTVVVFTFVLLLGNVLKELFPLLLNRQATFGMIAQAVGLLIPFVAAFALPIGMLTATLLVFGRFSADQELTAARASGVSLLSLVLPILVFSLFLCVVSAAVNLYIAPLSRVAYKNLIFDVRAKVLSQVQIPAGRPISDFKGYIIYVDKNRRQELENILLVKLKPEGDVELTFRAPRGRIEVDTANQKLTLRLFNATIFHVSGGFAGVAREVPIEINFGGLRKSNERVKVSDMTIDQLREALGDLERRFALPPAPENASPDELRQKRAQLEKDRDDITEPIRVQIHQQVAFSFACFSFTIIGIPLGIRVHRRETNVGIALALGLVAIYYALLIVANSQSGQAELAPHLWMWIPNFLFQAVGVVLLWRANRGI